LNCAAKAAVAFFDAARMVAKQCFHLFCRLISLFQHLVEQDERDQEVKSLAARIPLIFQQVEDMKESQVSPKRLADLMSHGVGLFRECGEFIIQYCSTPLAGMSVNCSIYA
jgi:hypothetical protein